MNFYNENDRKAAAWLRELIKAKLIPNGEVDERSICDVKASDLKGFTQHHFFAGIGGWPIAFRLAGWPDKRKVISGSCPCQPWSIANVAHGGARGAADERHLWPVFYRLLRELDAVPVFGEQVVKSIRMHWLDLVATDMEAIGHAFGATVLPARAFGADHERRRIWWMAHPSGSGRKRHLPLKRVPVAEKASFPINGDAFTRARRALDGDFSGLLPCDGVSVQLERDALKGYGNAIPVPVAAEFIQACEEVMP